MSKKKFKKKRKKQSQLCFNSKDSTSLSKDKYEKEEVKSRFYSFSVAFLPQRVPWCSSDSPPPYRYTNTFLFLTQLLLLTMTALPYGTTDSAPSSHIKLIAIVFTPHFSDSQTQLHQELYLWWPVPPRGLQWVYIWMEGESQCVTA